MILKVRGGRDVEVRSFALTNMVSYGYDQLRGSGNSVSTSAPAIPAINRAARIRSEAVASLSLKCWKGPKSALKTEAPNVWQARLFAAEQANEYQTRFAFWDAVEESLAYRGNAYIWKLKSDGKVISWYALHPDQVSCQPDEKYQVGVAQGYLDPVGKGRAKYVVGTDTILHIRGHGDGGKLEAPSPVQVFKDALAAPLARQAHELRMWNRGTALQGVLTFPAGTTPEEADSFRASWDASFSGLQGATTGVVGGGAAFQPVGMTFADAEFVALANLTVEDAARIMGVGANLLGVQLQKNVPNLEQDLSMWLRFGLGPELSRIESALAADRDLFGGALTYPMFDTNDFVRGDMQTEANVMHQQVQDGTLLQDEARAMKGLPPLPGGVGSIPQITPAGAAPNATTPAPAES